MRKLENPRKHQMNCKVDIDTLNEVKHQASTKGVTVSTFMYEALKLKIKK